MIIILTLYALYKKYNNIKNNSYILLKINDIIYKIYWLPLEHLHDKIAPDLPGSARFFVYIIKFIHKGNIILRTKIYHHCYVIFSYFPPCVTSIIFFIEIIYYNQLKYFFFSLMLLLIPIIFNIYLKLCISFYERNVDQFVEMLNITERRDEKNNLTWIFSFKPNYSQNSVELLDEVSKDFMLLYYVKFHAETIKELKNTYYPQILIITSLIYLIAGNIEYSLFLQKFLK